MNAEIAPTINAKTVYCGTLTDSRRWEFYRPRIGDIIVTTPPKSGTTWTQGILALLISGDPGVDANPSFNAPWFDNSNSDKHELVARLDAQKNQRQVKTHTPLDGLPFWDQLRYITIYRHPIDVHFSARKHVANYDPESAKALGVDLARFPADPHESFRIFIEGTELDHGSLKTIVKHFQACLDMEPRENVLRLHYADMQRNLGDCVVKIAEHVGITHPPDLIASLVEAATFGSMKSNAKRFGPAAGKEFWRDDASFFESGSSNKWEGVLTKADLAIYNEAISQLVEPEERHWLEWGNDNHGVKLMEK